MDALHCSPAQGEMQVMMVMIMTMALVDVSNGFNCDGDATM